MDTEPEGWTDTEYKKFRVGESESDDDSDEEDEEDEDEDEDEEEAEVFSITINGKSYFTDDDKNGDIYEDVDDDIGNIVGQFKNGVSSLF